MNKLIQGIKEFREKLLPERREIFARLAKGQSPDVLFVTCSDSRVAPNWFASTDPGDLFVVRNVGNLIPPCHHCEVGENKISEFAAVEFAVIALNVRDIIVCGHSECGAMYALAYEKFVPNAPHLRDWLSHGHESVKTLDTGKTFNPKLSREDQLSQLNVLQQLEHLKTYPLIQKRLAEGTLKIHAWWFDIADAGVYCFDDGLQNFRLV